ncbi:Hypothetical predicted protein, partial [Marmota monax]
PCPPAAARGSRVRNASRRWGCRRGMGATGSLWVFLALFAPGVLGELGGGSAEVGMRLGQGRLQCPYAKHGAKSGKTGTVTDDCPTGFGNLPPQSPGGPDCPQSLFWE